jgi:hypothetical protein
LSGNLLRFCIFTDTFACLFFQSPSYTLFFIAFTEICFNFPHCCPLIEFQTCISATVLGSIPASSNKVESERGHMKNGWKKDMFNPKTFFGVLLPLSSFAKRGLAHVPSAFL